MTARPPSATTRGLRVLQLLAMVNLAALAGLAALIWLQGPAAGPLGPTTPGVDVEATRSLAARLRSSGLLVEALPSYEQVLSSGALSPAQGAALAYEVGAALIDEGAHEQGLVWLYRVELLAPDSSHVDEARTRIVHGLEALGRYRQAAFVQDRATSLEQGPADDEGGLSALRTVATIGADRITMADIEEELDQLPDELRRQLTGARLTEFAQQVVAREVLYRKAQREGVTEEAAVRRAGERALRSAVVDQLMRRELGEELAIDEADVRNWFAANQDRFGPEARYEDHREQAVQGYAAEKQARLLDGLFQEAMQARDVRFYPEALENETGLSGFRGGAGRNRPSLLGGSR